MVFGPNDVAGRAADRTEIGVNRIFKLFCVSVAVASTLTTAAMAQWSIGQPGSREPPPGLNRYVYLVMSDPMPGREFDFNDGYQNMHMGDLVQLPGWTGGAAFSAGARRRAAQHQAALPARQSDHLGSGRPRSRQAAQRCERCHRRWQE